MRVIGTPTANHTPKEGRDESRNVLTNLATFDYNEARAILDYERPAEVEALLRRCYREAVDIARTSDYPPSRESVVLWGGELADLLKNTGRYDEGHEIMEEMIRLWRQFRDSAEGTPMEMDYLAQGLLTCIYPDLRDPHQAVVYAKRAAELTHGRNSRILLTLAEARLATGDVVGCRDTVAQVRNAWTPNDEQFRGRLNELERRCIEISNAPQQESAKP